MLSDFEDQGRLATCANQCVNGVGCCGGIKPCLWPMGRVHVFSVAGDVVGPVGESILPCSQSDRAAIRARPSWVVNIDSGSEIATEVA